MQFISTNNSQADYQLPFLVHCCLLYSILAKKSFHQSTAICKPNAAYKCHNKVWTVSISYFNSTILLNSNQSKNNVNDKMTNLI